MSNPEWDDDIAIEVADLDPADGREAAERAARTLALIRRRETGLRTETAAALLRNYNENWHGDDDENDDGSAAAPMGAAAFEDHLRLTGITFYADGGAELFYDAGGLFLGHTVVVAADEAGQFLHATLAG